jgi:hypothetical protein
LGGGCAVDVVIIIDLLSSDVANFYRTRRFAERVVAAAQIQGRFTARYVVARLEEIRSITVVHNVDDQQSIDAVQTKIADILTANPIGKLKEIVSVLRGDRSSSRPKRVVLFTSANENLGRFLAYAGVLSRSSDKTIAVAPYESFSVEKRAQLLRLTGSEKLILDDPTVEHVADVIGC